MSRLQRCGLVLCSLWLIGASSVANAECSNPKGWKPSLSWLRTKEAAHKAPFVGAEPSDGISACNADLSGAQLAGEVLDDGDFADADLSRADLTGASLGVGHLENAKLSFARLRGAVLGIANLSHANLSNADLASADLTGASLNGADLTRTILAGANLNEADVTRSRYAPKSGPPASVWGLVGLSTVRFNNPTGVLEIREIALRTGQRSLEREATYAIESARTRDLLFQRHHWDTMLTGLFRLMVFEWTTDYGLHPVRPLFLICGLLVLLTPVYGWTVSRAAPPDRESGIFLRFPAGLILSPGGAPRWAGEDKVSRLSAPPAQALAWGAYFSLHSAFQVGFRDWNVGDWIGRMQPRPFEIHALGWVRSLSGVQSLFSLAFLVLWLLTEFGRPFQ